MFRKLHRPENSVTVTIDGVALEGEAGEPLAAVLLRSSSIHARCNPVSGEPRAPFCMMGVCQDCLAVVDGMGSVQTCQTPVHDGMQVRRQLGARSIGDV
jgi:predicted molibdopterin-dependent oxidoreductase YjgC